MKYGILTYSHRPMRPGSKNMLNIGDPIQSYAMKYLYGLLGIDEKNLVEVSRYHARDYDGEEVLLPFNAFNMIYNQFGHPYGALPVSNKITPVFVSFHLHSRKLERAILDNLQAYQPIGCRDEETMLNMRSHGLQAYISGCVTALLPKRNNIPSEQKTFLVDIPKDLISYIPDEIKQNAEFVQHQIQFERISDDAFMTEEEYDLFYQKGVSQLLKYKEEATLVVTSRLHAAAPCMAMGIPVILVSDNFDGRFSWLDKYLPFYTPELFSKIEWSPSAVEYEDEKRMITEIILKQIQGKPQKYEDINRLSAFYENRHRETYNKGFLCELGKLPVVSQSKVKFAVWGLIAQTQTFINVVEDNYPNWRLEAIIDKAAIGSYEGLGVQKPSVIEALDQDIIYFILPEAAHEEARELLTKLGRRFVIVCKYQMEYHDYIR